MEQGRHPVRAADPLTPPRSSATRVIDGRSTVVDRRAHGRGPCLRRAPLLGVAVIYPLSGGLNYSHRGLEGRLATGIATLFQNDNPGQVGSATDSNFVAIVLPRTASPRSRGHLERPTARKWSRSSRALELLKAYVGGLVSLGSDPPTEIVEHVLDLIRLAADEELRDASATREDFQSRAQVHLVIDDIRLNHRDPDVSIDCVAARRGFSMRHLQRPLEAAGTHFTEQVTAHRRQSAYQTLTAPGRADQTVSDIALVSGFSDLSHFDRLFKRRFGTTPEADRAGRRLLA